MRLTNRRVTAIITNIQKIEKRLYGPEDHKRSKAQEYAVRGYLAQARGALYLALSDWIEEIPPK